MVRYKILIVSVFFVMFLLQSCVHGDLDDCPPMVSYAVAFQYTDHTGREDRFYDDVKKIDLYVFDKNNLVYTTTTKLGLYDENFNIPLDLPMGNYNIIAWGNALDNQPFSITPDNFVKGETTFDEARLRLQKTAGELNDTELEKLFFGELRNVEIPLYVSRIDTVSLMNNTERIRIVLHWDFTKAAGGQGFNHDSISVRLNGTNSLYRFDNERVAANVKYAPFKKYFTDNLVDSINTYDKRDWLKINYYSNEFKEISKTTIYDFTVLRLFKDIPMNLVVEYVNRKSGIFHPIADVDIVSRNTGFEFLFTHRGIIESQWQRTFDINELYEVDMYIIFDGVNTFTTGDIQIKDWWKVEDENGAGAV